MQTVDTLLDQVKTRHGIKSDYKLAQFLKVTQNTVANYRHGRSRPDDITLARLAELAGVPAEDIDLLAVQLQAERASTDQARELWSRIAARLQGGAIHSALLACLVALGFITSTPSAHAVVTDVSTSSGSVYYVKYLIAQERLPGLVRRPSPSMGLRRTRCHWHSGIQL